MLNYDLLIGLRAVITEGSFEDAAKLLNLTPSAVSQRVKSLEDSLKTLLIIRSKPCKPTELGYSLLKHIEKIEFLEKNLLDQMPKHDSANSGKFITLRIAVNEDSMSTWFPKALQELSKLNNFLFDIIIENQDQTTDLLRAGEVIAAVTSSKKPVQGFKTIYLGSLYFCAVSTPEFKEKYFPNNIFDFSTLKVAPCLAFDRKDSLPEEWIKKICNKKFVTPTNWIPSLDGYLKTCLLGLGWGVYPHSLLEKSLNKGELVELVPNERIEMPLYWRYSKSHGKVILDITNSISNTCEKILIKENNIQ